LFNSKSRRKDKESTAPLPTKEEYIKPYLDEDFVQERFLDVDCVELVVLPPGLDYNEWLATNSKCTHAAYSTCKLTNLVN